MDFFDVYILTRLVIEEHGNVTAENVDVTFDIHEAEAHREKGVENDFESSVYPPIGATMRRRRTWSKRCASSEKWCASGKRRRYGEHNETIQIQVCCGRAVPEAAVPSSPPARTRSRAGRCRQKRSCEQGREVGLLARSSFRRSRSLRAQSRSGDPHHARVDREPEIPAIFEGCV